MKTKNIIASLEEFVEVYYGPPLLLTSDGGPQFGAANRATTEWVNETGINHELLAAYSPQSKGEAEATVKHIKYAIKHSDGTPNGINSLSRYQLGAATGQKWLTCRTVLTQSSSVPRPSNYPSQTY